MPCRAVQCLISEGVGTSGSSPVIAGPASLTNQEPAEATLRASRLSPLPRAEIDKELGTHARFAADETSIDASSIAA
jgi:hypothetical protein